MKVQKDLERSAFRDGEETPNHLWKMRYWNDGQIFNFSSKLLELEELCEIKPKAIEYFILKVYTNTCNKNSGIFSGAHGMTS